MHKKAKIEVKSGKTTFVKVSKKCTINGIAWKRERGAITGAAIGFTSIHRES